MSVYSIFGKLKTEKRVISKKISETKFIVIRRYNPVFHINSCLKFTTHLQYPLFPNDTIGS